MKKELICDLNISVRLDHVLKNINVTTIVQALNIPKWKYLESRNMGKGTMMELEEVLSEFPEFPESIFNCSFSTPRIHIRKIEELIGRYQYSMAKRKEYSQKLEAIEECLFRQMHEIINEHANYQKSVTKGITNDA